jgi:putative ABC transport system permease protein
MLRSDKVSRMELKVLFSEDPAFVIKRADKFLSSEPVLHNLILSILHSRVAQGDPGRYWIASHGEEAVGVVVQINSLLRMSLPSPGFDAANVLTMAVNLPENEVKYVEKIPGEDMERISPNVTAFHQQLLERVTAMPGVESVGMISTIPPMGAGMRSFSILTHPAPSTENRPEGFFNEVSPSYFRAMKIQLKKGRYLEESDTESAPWVVLISETLARRYFPNEDPIGQQILLRYEPQRVDEERPRQIVGVVGEVKQIGMGGVHPLLYESILQQPEVFPGGSEIFHLWGSLVIRTNSDVRVHEADITTSLKQMVKDMDPDQPVTDISTMERSWENS